MDIITGGTLNSTDNVVNVTNTLATGESGIDLDIECPLATIDMAWTSALKIDITQTSAKSGTWNTLGRMLGILIDVNVTGELTNAFGVMSRINLKTDMTSGDDVNDVQALVGVVNVNLSSGDTLSGETASTICGVKGSVSRSTSGIITVEHNVAAGVFTYNMDGSTVSGKSSIIELYNYGSDTVDAGIYMNPFGTLTTGIELDTADGGSFVTGITIDPCSSGIGINSESSILALKVVTGQDAAMIGRATVSSSISDAGLIRGIVGYVDVDGNGTLDDDSLQIAGVHGQVIGAGTFTEVSSLAAVWADSQISEVISAGTLSLFRGTNNGDTEITYMIDLWGTAEYFLRAEGVGGGTAWHSHASSDAGAESGFLLCLVGNQVRKIKLYALA